MKILIKSIAPKVSLTALAILLMQTLSFAAEKLPEVYVSQAPVSNLSGQQILNTTWVWVLLAIVVLVFIIAFFAAGTENKTGEPHAL